MIELSLLRSADNPSVACDRGTHAFTYWLYPHQGTVREAGIAQKGYELNVPLRTVSGFMGEADQKSFFAVDSSDVIIDTVKPAEDGNGMILRLFETYNTAQRCALRFGFPVRRVEETDLMEKPIDGQTLEADENGAIKLSIHPYEIKTYRIEM